MIKNLVLSAGAAGGLYIYGALKASHQNGIWKHENIQTIWGTSFGSILCVVVAMNCEWDVLDDYLIKRPWQTVFKMNWLDLWIEKGLMYKNSIKEAMAPVFQASEIPLDITLGDFCAKTGKELHMFVTELDMNRSNFRLVDINPITHPEWLVLDAVYASCCLPLIFKPFEMTDGVGFGVDGGGHEVDMSGNSVAVSKTRVFLDGAILCGFPYYECLKHSLVQEEEVFGIYLTKSKNSTVSSAEGKTGLSNMNLFDFMKVFSSAVFNYTNHNGRESPKSEKALLVKLVVDMHERFDWNVIRTEEKRVEYISKGAEMFSQFLEERLAESLTESLSESLTESLSERLSERLVESGHEIICDVEVGDLDSHRISSDL